MVSIMNKTLGVKKIKQYLKSKQIDPQVVDVHSNYDSTLSFNENKTHFKKIISKLKREEKSYKTRQGQYLNKVENKSERRSHKQLIQDNTVIAKNVFDPETITPTQFKKWTKTPNRYDIYGIDAPPQESGDYVSDSFSEHQTKLKSDSIDKRLIKIIDKQDISGGDGVYIDDIFESYNKLYKSTKLTNKQLDNHIEKLLEEGIIYEPKRGCVKIL